MYNLCYISTCSRLQHVTYQEKLVTNQKASWNQWNKSLWSFYLFRIKQIKLSIYVMRCFAPHHTLFCPYKYQTRTLYRAFVQIRRNRKVQEDSYLNLVKINYVVLCISGKNCTILYVSFTSCLFELTMWFI